MTEAKFINSTINKKEFRNTLIEYLKDNSNITNYKFVNYLDMLETYNLHLATTFSLGILDNCLFISL